MLNLNRKKLKKGRLLFEMASKTFLNLAPEKKQRITTALLTEFSHYPLVKAQVARIIKNADIARGAFYKYFDDLTDAYDYIYRCALADIRPHLSSNSSATELLDATRDFLTATSASPYFEFIKLHLTVNEKTIVFTDHKRQLAPKRWALINLCHQTICEAMLDPKHTADYLARLEAVSLTLFPTQKG